MKGTKARFEGRQTLVKGIEVNIQTQEFTPFEEYVSYTRSLEKAKKLVEEQRGCDKDNSIVISVTELVQEKPKAVEYNIGKLLEYGTLHLTEDDAVNDLADKPNYTIAKVTVWSIGGYVWYFDFIECEYKTKFVQAFKPNKIKAHDLKTILGFEIASNYFDNADEMETIAIHDTSQIKLDAWVTIAGDKLQYCIKED